MRAAGGFETVNGIDQSHGGDLGQVIQRLAAAGEPAGDVVNSSCRT